MTRIAFALGAIAMVAGIVAAVWVAVSDTSSRELASSAGLATPTSSLSRPEQAEADASSSIPGTYVLSQGRSHFADSYSPGRVETPFCPGVSWSGASTPEPTPDVVGTPAIPTGCFNSNPPSSGKHLNVQNNVDVGNGVVIKLPPDPDIYPPGVVIPRDAIPHILEHAGVFVGYNCDGTGGDCDAVVERIKSLVEDRLQSGDRIVMAYDDDLVPDTIGLSSWTRVYVFKYEDYDAPETQRFMDVHSCRFDPEGFCR